MPPKGRKRKASTADGSGDESSSKETKRSSMEIKKGMDKQDLNQFGVQELREYLEKKGFHFSGRKTILVNRVYEYLETGEAPKVLKRKRKKDDKGWMTAAQRRSLEKQKEHFKKKAKKSSSK